MKVEVAILGSPSLISLVVSADVKQHSTNQTSTKTTRLIRDGEVGGSEMEAGGEGDYIPITTLSPAE